MKNWKIPAIIIIVLILGGLSYYLIQPEAPQIEEPVSSITTPTAIPVETIESIERIGSGESIGPEDVAIDSRGRIYGGMNDGKIWRYQADGSKPEIFADTEGRPLGLHFDKSENLIVADAYKGLLSIDPEGSITTLSTSADGVPFLITDDVDIAEDGTIYFSDASHKHSLEELEAAVRSQTGRLLAYDPDTKTTQVLLENLSFANGVAVSPDQSFVLVVETSRMRVQRYWLTGPNQGESEIFIDGLPQWPDGISSNRKDIFWVAISAQSGRFLGLDSDGKIIYNFQVPSYHVITSVQEHEGMLYLGSLEETAIGRLHIP